MKEKLIEQHLFRLNDPDFSKFAGCNLKLKNLGRIQSLEIDIMNYSLHCSQEDLFSRGRHTSATIENLIIVNNKIDYFNAVSNFPLHYSIACLESDELFKIPEKIKNIYFIFDKNIQTIDDYISKIENKKDLTTINCKYFNEFLFKAKSFTEMYNENQKDSKHSAWIATWVISKSKIYIHKHIEQHEALFSNSKIYTETVRVARELLEEHLNRFNIRDSIATNKINSKQKYPLTNNANIKDFMLKEVFDLLSTHKETRKLKTTAIEKLIKKASKIEFYVAKEILTLFKKMSKLNLNDDYQHLDVEYSANVKKRVIKGVEYVHVFIEKPSLKERLESLCIEIVLFSDIRNSIVKLVNVVVPDLKTTITSNQEHEYKDLISRNTMTISNFKETDIKQIIKYLTNYIRKNENYF